MHVSLFPPELCFVLTFLSFISGKACDLQRRVKNSPSFLQANCLKMQSGRSAQIFIIPRDATVANYTSLWEDRTYRMHVEQLSTLYLTHQGNIILNSI